MRLLPLFLLLIVQFGWTQNKNPLADLVAKDSLLHAIFEQPDKFQAQLIYTQINRSATNEPSFVQYELGTDDKKYFYPASTVKMPTAFMALEKINELNLINLNRHTPMLQGTGRTPQTPVTNDPSAENGLPSLAHYIKKIFVVSDNDAYNRLYEFLGQAYFNQNLHAKGFDRTRIIHRLGISGFDVEGNRYTNPVSFIDNDKLLYHQGQAYSIFQAPFQLEQEIRGKAQMANEGEILEKPFDFRYKNYVSLQDLHDILRVVIFPEAFEEHQRFNLTPEDYEFLYRVMSTLPDESQFPKYEGKSDDYVKFYMTEVAKDSIPDHIRIFNKVGWAYGFLTDVSYIVDFETGIEFMVAATIHVNENETYNDGVYEYESIGLPFFGRLGKMLMNYEKARSRKHKADLSRFKVKKYY